MSENGKGSLPRPKSVSVLTFDENWKRTFGHTDVDEDGIPHNADKVCPPLGFHKVPDTTKAPWVKKP